MQKTHDIQEIIKEQIKKSPFLKKEMLDVKWKDIVGENLAKKSRPVFIKEGKLKVQVESSIWLQEMRFLERDILKKVNTFLSDEEVKEIYFKVGKINDKKFSNINMNEKEYERIDINNVTLSREDIYLIKKEIKDIENPDIKKRIYKVISNNKKREKALLKKGYKKCGKCGSIHKNSGDKCTICLEKSHKKQERELLQDIKNNLGISFIGLKKRHPYINENDYIRAKNKLKDKYQRKMNIYLKEDNTKKAYENAYKYYVLETGIEDKKILKDRIYGFLKNVSHET
ncbi:MAG: DUF721 domain-containing protein [Fusobacteriota bacterium]